MLVNVRTIPRKGDIQRYCSRDIVGGGGIFLNIIRYDHLVRGLQRIGSTINHLYKFYGIFMAPSPICGLIFGQLHPSIPCGSSGGQVIQRQRYCTGMHAADRGVQKCIFSTCPNFTQLCLRHMVINPYVLYL